MLSVRMRCWVSPHERARAAAPSGPDHAQPRDGLRQFTIAQVRKLSHAHGCHYMAD
jgi:hypothetical protein